jgi:hypothetical protein
MIFQSLQGLHSLQTTDQFGDVGTKFMSAVVNRLWDEDHYFNKRKVLDDRRSVVAYVPERSRVYIGVALQGDDNIKHVFEFNLESGHWSGPWDMEASGMAFVRLSSPELATLMLGSESGDVSYHESDRRQDHESTGYTFKLSSPRMDGRSIDTDLTSRSKRWIELRVFIRPRGAPWKLTLDASTEEQGLMKQQAKNQNLHKRETLTNSFQLDLTKLQDSESIGVLQYRIDLWGRYLEFTLSQDGVDENIEIMGYEVDFEPGNITQENI